MLPVQEVTKTAMSAREKIASYRRRMREKGYRQITLWVPDLNNPSRLEKIEREAHLLRLHPGTKEGDMFAQAALAEIEGWE
jgi:Protein  of unknown function (DUF3018)